MRWLPRVFVALTVALSVVTLALWLHTIDGSGQEHVHHILVNVLWAIAPLTLGLVAVAVICWAFRASSVGPANSPNDARAVDRIWSDTPVSLDVQDEFDRLRFVDALGDVIAAVRSSNTSSVIGLAAPWGAGKTSVLVTLMERLSKASNENSWLIAQLNPWRYSSLDALTAAFFVQLRAAIPPGSRWDESREAVGRVLASIAPFGTLTGMVGFDSTKGLDSLAKKMGVGDWWRTQGNAQEALERLERPILMVIDDADRLTPDELLALLRLIRQVGRLPNVHYLLAFDETSLVKLLAHSGVVAKNGRSARDYLEKMIQVRIALPPLRVAQVNRVVDSALDAMIARYSVSDRHSRSKDFAFTYQQFIAPLLTTPRRIERWLSHVRLLFPPLAKDVDFFDFIAFRWAVLEWPRLPDFLIENRGRVFPDAIWLAQTKDQSVESERGWWQEHSRAIGGSEERGEVVFSVLTRLFPTIDAYTNSLRSSPNLDSTRERKGIGHPDYFDRYFGMALPTEDLSETDFERGMAELLEWKPERETAPHLTDALLEDTSRVAPLIESWVAENPQHRSQVAAWLARVIPSAEDWDLLSARQMLRGLLFRLVAASDQAAELAAGLWTESDTPIAAATLAEDLLSSSRLPESERAALRTFASQRLASLVDESVGELSNMSRDFWFLLWRWRAIDPAMLRRWYVSRVEEGTHTLVDALAGIVSSAHPVGVPDPRAYLTGLEASSVDEFLGEAWLRRRLRDGRDDLMGSRAFPDDFHGLDDTWDNRRAIALGYLDRVIASMG